MHNGNWVSFLDRSHCSFRVSSWGNEGGTGIITLLQHIIANAAAMESEAKHAEEQAPMYIAKGEMMGRKKQIIMMPFRGSESLSRQTCPWADIGPRIETLFACTEANF